MAPLLLNISVLSVLICRLFVGQVEPRACAYDHFTIESGSGNLTCWKCPLCQPRLGLFPQCGSTLSNHNIEIKCEPCVLGKTYSEDEDTSSCKPCDSCTDHQTVVKNCTLVSDSQCEHTCPKGYYFEDLTGDYQPCSWCCSDGSNKVRSGCKDLPFYKQCEVNIAKNCKPKCQIDQYVFPGSKGGGFCENCNDCPPGTSHFPECGSVVENTEQVICKSCIEGWTFSDNYGTSQCKPCTRCSFGQKEVLPCNLTNDRVCSDCDKGFYRDVNNTLECKPCSACCNGDKDVHIEKCAEQKMPKNFQCSQAIGVGSVCQSESNKEPKSLVPVFIATSVAAGFVILLSVSVYYWMIKFRRHKVLTSHQSRTLLLAGEEAESRDTGFEDPTVSGLQETLRFEKSGVILQFSDPESFVNGSQGIR